MGPALPVIAIATTIGGTAASVSAQRRAQREQSQAQKIASRQAAVENQRRIRQAIAAARADRANLLASGFAQTGGFDSSGIAGGAAAADTQLASNVGFARQTQAFNQATNNRLQRANRAAGQANTFGAIAGLPTQLGFDVRGSFNQLRQGRPSNPQDRAGTT